MENYYVSDILFTIFYYIVNISEKHDHRPLYLCILRKSPVDTTLQIIN